MSHIPYGRAFRALVVIVAGISAVGALAQEAARVKVIQLATTEIFDEFSLTGTVTSQRSAAL